MMNANLDFLAGHKYLKLRFKKKRQAYTFSTENINECPGQTISKEPNVHGREQCVHMCVSTG